MSATSELLTRKEAARYLRISPKTLATWKTTQKVNVPHLKIGRRVVYRRGDLEKWLNGLLVNTQTINFPKTNMESALCQ